MKSNIKRTGLLRVANSYVRQLDQSSKLREIATRRNYPAMLKTLYEKVTAESTFWNNKQTAHREKLLDLKKDLIFIETQKALQIVDKDRVNLLLIKYGLK